MSMPNTPNSIQGMTAVTVLKAIMQHTDNLFAAIDTDYRFLAFNQLFSDEFKRVYGREVSIGFSLKELLDHRPLEKQQVLNLWGRGLAGEEFTIVHEFGDLARNTYEIRFYPIRNEQNELIGTFQLVQNVTNKKNMLDQLQESDQRYHGLFDTAPVELRIFAEAMPQMAFIADPQGNITYYNQRHYDYFGLNKGESEDWKWLESNMHHPDDLPGTVAKWAQSIQSGEPYEVEYRLRRHDGSFRWHLARALPVKNSEGSIIRWVGTNTDIDHQKKVTQQLDQLLREVEFQRNRFEAVVKQMPAAVIIGEAPTGKLIYANDKMAEVWGHELIPSQNISDYIKWVGFHTDGRPYRPEEWPLARSISKGEVINNEDVEIRRQDGTRAILRLSSTPIYDHLGEIAAGVVICQDVTELKEAIRGRDEFLSICSHELKTPLTSLKLISQGVQRNIRKGDPLALSPERMTRLLKQTECQVNRLTRLIEDMLDISRINSGKISLEMQPVDLAHFLRDMAERLSPLFEEAGASLIIDADESISSWGDPHRLEQVMTNLLSNAAKYGQGKPVTMKLKREDNYAIVSIKDQGMGIAAENHERIFNRYERLVSANEISGLGLGLFITKQILELHQGKIWLESQLGQGSTFFVALPLHELKK
jgi:PAS domain S-box-containing protein